MVKKFFLICLFSTLFLGAFSSAQAFYLDIQPRVGYYLPTQKDGQKLLTGKVLVYQVEASGHFAHYWEDIPWKFWVNASYLPGSGHLRSDRHRHHHGLVRIDSNDQVRDRKHHHHHHQFAHTWWIPYSGGLKYSWNLCACGYEFGALYLGLGAEQSYIRIKVENDFFERRISKGVLGAVIKSGWRVDLFDCFFMDIFADYHFMTMTYRKRHSDFFELNTPDFSEFSHLRHRKGHYKLHLSGFMVGGGLGFSF